MFGNDEITMIVPDDYIGWYATIYHFMTTYDDYLWLHGYIHRKRGLKEDKH